jgi:soluble lytic murein transglycosylase-like protein
VPFVLPPPGAPIPTTAVAIVAALHRDEQRLVPALGRWNGNGPPPRDVVLLALHRERILRFVGPRPALARTVLRLAPSERDDVRAREDLSSLARGLPPLRVRIRVGAAPPAPKLLAWYRESERRFGVRWQVLAAVNFVESLFGKIRNTSVAGAQGPMQFLPATWRRYGLGGDVRDPHDAIIGAANLLRANGAAHDERASLLHYNRSTAYADAVLRYAHRMTVSPTAFLEYYSWQVFVRTPSGERRVTGP